MKIPPRKIPQFLEALPEVIKTILLYGPDQGLVRERADQITKGIVDDVRDPFRVTEIRANNLRDNAALLLDEASAISFTGEKRVIRVRDATDAISKAITDYCEAPSNESLVIFEAGNLAPRSKIRSVFERAETAAAIACYVDEEKTLKDIIIETFDKENYRTSPDAFEYLIENLGGDRMVSRAELEKLCLYMVGKTEISLADAMACVGDSASMTIDDIAFAAASGNIDKLARLMARARNEGAASVAVLRRVARHLERLHIVADAIKRGTPWSSASKLLRPPVFFKQSPAFQMQLKIWPPERLEQAIESITQAEILCKTTGVPADSICDQELLRVAATSQMLAKG